MTVLRPLGLAVTAIGIGFAISRHPAVRASIKAAPLLVTPRMRMLARERALDTAYNAGVVARRIVPRNLI